MGKKRPIKVGLDFDGVVAYNPARVVRAPITLVKKRVLGVKRLKFFVPTDPWQQLIWKVMHESSVFPARGVDRLKAAVAEGEIEAHLVTARFNFLNQNLEKWLKRYGLEEIFKTVNANLNNDQPHLFKERLINKYKFKYFIEDNLDIVNYLDNRVNTQICWVYNILDRLFNKRPGSFAYLEEALIWITAEEKKRKS